MANTTFTDQQTVIMAAWLNDVNKLTYGNSEDTKGAALLQFMAGGSTDATRTVQDKLREVVSVKDYGTGLNSAALDAALAASNAVYIPYGHTVTLTTAVVIAANKTIYGGGTIVCPSGSVVGLYINGNNIKIQGITINGGGGTQFSLGSYVADGYEGLVIDGCTFTGDAYYYIGVNTAINPKIINNTFDGSGGVTIGHTCISLLENINPTVHNNTFNETGGFGIQIGVSQVGFEAKGGSVTDNTFYQPNYQDTFTSVTGLETSRTFTLSKACIRGSLLAGATEATAVPIAWTLAPIVAGQTTFTPTFAAQSAGTVLVWRGWRCLENINILGKVTDLLIEGNVINGSGDGGIVFGEDTPNTGRPQRITVTGNTIRNCAFTGIVQTQTGCTATIQGNTITDCGQSQAVISTINSDAAGISVTTRSGTYGGGQNVVVGNTITNTLQYMTAGVMINGNNPYNGSESTGAATKDYLLGSNVFTGTFNYRYFINQTSNLGLMEGVMVTDGMERPYPASISLDIDSSAATWQTAIAATPVNSQYFTYAANGVGVNANTIGAAGGSACILGGMTSMKTFSASYVDIFLATEKSATAKSFFTQDIAKITFSNKMITGTAYLSIFGCYVSGATERPQTVYMAASAVGSAWSNYVMTVPCGGLSNIGRIRIGQVGNGTAYFQHIELAAIKYT